MLKPKAACRHKIANCQGKFRGKLAPRQNQEDREAAERVHEHSQRTKRDNQQPKLADQH